MALSGSLTTNAYGGVRSLTLTWSATQSVESNTSTINWTLSGSGSGGGYYVSGNFKVVMDGITVYTSATRINLWSGTVVATGSHTVAHNSDGTKSLAIRIEGGIYTIAVNCTAEQGFVLDTIVRKSVITAAPDFTDEDNPTISFSMPASGSNVSHDLYILRPGESLAVIAKKVTSQPFTLNFTQAERNLLRGLNTTANSTQIDLMLRTYVNGAMVGEDRIPRYLTIANPHPTLNPTVVDSNRTTVALTGSRSKLVKYYSDAKITFGAAAVKQATLQSKSVTCGGKSLTTDGTIQDVEDGTFVFLARDSRGNTTSKTVTKTLVNYVKLTCAIGSGVPDGNGAFTFSVSGNCFNGSFGAVYNTLTVQYRYRVAGGTYSSYKSMTVSKTGNTYQASVKLSGLDHTKTYQFQAKAVDKLATVTTQEKTVKSVPVFDFGENGFNVNGIFSVNGTSLLDLVYPVGSIYMTLASGAGPNPGDLFGGTWKRLENRFLVGTGNLYVVGQTGGDNTHAQTMTYMFPSPYVNASGVAYTDGGTVPNSTQYSGPADSRPPYLAVHMWQRTA